MARTTNRYRILADKSGGVQHYNHATREVELVNPDGGAWPVAGLEIMHEPHKQTSFEAKWLSRMITLGLAQMVGERVVECPGGPCSNPWRVRHKFVQCDAIVLKLKTGPIRYNVVRNPGSYTGERFTNEESIKAGEPHVVFWDYHADLQE